MATNLIEVKGSYKECFINGNKCRVWSYEDGRHVIGYFSETMSKYGENAWNVVKDASTRHGVNNAIWAPGITAEKIQELIPGAEIWWPGSAEYEARKAAATGSRPGGGNNTGKNAGGATAPSAPAVVASSDSFQVPGVNEVPPLASVLSIMPALVGGVNEWAAAVASSVLDNSECPELPENVAGAAALVPSLSPALDTYKAVITRAATDYMEKKAAAERAEAERLAALEAAKRAAESGKTLVKLFDGSTVEVEGKTHPQFAKVCQLIKKGRHVYLHGPAGTGKTYLCEQIARALGMEFFSDNKVANDFQLTGFVDAKGDLVPTEFYRACTCGKRALYLLDEADASDPNVATVLNSATANGFTTFAGVGRVSTENLVVVMTGNTIGRGADMEYCGRNPLDLATLDRLAFVAVGYDPEIELQKARGDKELVEFIHAVRSSAASCGISLISSYRAIDGCADMVEDFTPAECLDMFLLKGLERDQIKMLANGVPSVCRWSRALHDLAA